MRRNINPVSRRASGIKRHSVGVGRVILQTNVDRETYINHCYQCNSISLIMKDTLDVVHGVDVDIDVLQRIKFPESTELLGSTVVWVNIPIYNKIIVVAILNNNDELDSSLQELEFVMQRVGVEGIVKIQGYANKSTLDIVVHSNNQYGGKLTINVSNTSDSGQLELIVSGDLITYTNNQQHYIKDNYSTIVYDGKPTSKKTVQTITNKEAELRIQESTSGHKITEESYEVGDASDNAVLANQMKTFMESLIDVIASQTVATSLGPQPLMNAVGITQMKESIDTWISKYFKIQ